MNKKEKKPAKPDETMFSLKLPLTDKAIYEDSSVEVETPDRAVIVRRRRNTNKKWQQKRIIYINYTIFILNLFSIYSQYKVRVNLIKGHAVTVWPF